MILPNIPKISCILIDSFSKSISSFYEQAIIDKELIVVSKENMNLSPDIVFLKAPQKATMGAMLNTGAEIALGEIICQWGDSSPRRLILQYKALEGAVACVLKGFPETVMFRKSVFYHFGHRLFPESFSERSALKKIAEIGLVREIEVK